MGGNLQSQTVQSSDVISLQAFRQFYELLALFAGEGRFCLCSLTETRSY